MPESKLRLAANEAFFDGSRFGHFQVVLVKDSGEQREIEVQLERSDTTWAYRGPRDHSQHTPGFDDAARYKSYDFTPGDLEGRDPEQVWRVLEQVHKQFDSRGEEIGYSLGQNSNSYINTILGVVGIDLDRFEAEATPAAATGWWIPGIDDPFPGADKNVLENSGTAISLRLKGTGGVDFINTGAGTDRVRGRGGDDEINTGLGNDIITGGPDNDTIDGGNGFDKAVFLHDRKDYLIREFGDGTVSVEDLKKGGEGRDGVDILTSIEQLIFADQTLDVEMRLASDPDYLARTAVVGGGSRPPEKVADAPEPKPGPKPEPGPRPEPETVQDLGGNKPSDKQAEDPKPEPGPRPEPPAPETVQDLGGDKPSGQDSSGDEKIDFAGLPPPPPPLPPGPPPSLLRSEPEPGPEPEPPVSDTVQDLGGNEPTASNDEIFIA